MTLATTAPLDAAFLAEIEAYLSAYGLKVTKTRATSSATTARADGCAPARVTASKHARCAGHWRVPGMDKPVCIAPAGTVHESGRDTGEPIGPEWVDVDTVLAFAVDVGARRADASRVMRAAALREAEARHAEHAEQARVFAARTSPDSLAGTTGAHVQRGPDPSAWRYIGAPDCWACVREYRGGEVPMADWQARNASLGAGDTSPSRCDCGTRAARLYGVATA